MLVLQGKAIYARRVELRVTALRLVVGDHALAATRVARKRIAGKRIVGGHESCLYQRRGYGDKTRGVTTGVCDALARCYGRTLLVV